VTDRDPDARGWVTWWALQLAEDLETARALLRGEPVDPACLRPEWLARAKAARLVRLDVRAIDAFYTSLGEEPVAA
jgi:hypothetical protein